MKQTISKSQLKPHLLEYLRKVKEEKKELIITHFGKPVVKIVPYKDKSKDPLSSLQGTLIFYKAPTDPVGLEDWEVLK
jgi:prevent-host-death family protein